MNRREWVDHFVEIRAGGITLPGSISIPTGTQAVVVLVHGSGSSRLSPRNQFVARQLQAAHLGTLLFDLLTSTEERIDNETREFRFNIGLLAGRTTAVVGWLADQPETQGLHIGLFGASTGAAAALITAAQRTRHVGAVVSRGGRPDLAGTALAEVRAPSLFIVGALDDVVIDLNKQAIEQMPQDTEKQLEIVPGATHLFEEPGTLEQVADLAGDWFVKHLVGDEK